MGPFRIIKWMEDDGRTIKNIYQNLIKTNQPENYSSSFQLVSALGSKKAAPEEKSPAWHGLLTRELWTSQDQFLNMFDS